MKQQIVCLNISTRILYSHLTFLDRHLWMFVYLVPPVGYWEYGREV